MEHEEAGGEDDVWMEHGEAGGEDDAPTSAIWYQIVVVHHHLYFAVCIDYGCGGASVCVCSCVDGGEEAHDLNSEP
jgi:hypothetical protein